MRNLILGVSVGLAALVSVAPAQAATAPFVHFYASGTTKTLPSNTTVIADFDGTNGGHFTGSANNRGTSAVSFGPPGTPVRRPADATGDFAYVIGGSGNSGGKYTINFSPAQVFTFVFGSLNTTNSLTLNFVGLPSRTFTGGELAGLQTNQAAGQSGRFYYDAAAVGGAAGSIVSAVFSSGVGAAFEFDSIATAAPEPATWAMMILGFGLIGGSLRRKRPVRTMAIA